MSEDPPTPKKFPFAPSSNQPASKREIHASQLEGNVIDNLKLLKSLIRGEKVRLFQFQQSELSSEEKTNSAIDSLKQKIIGQFLHFDMKRLASISIPKKLQTECLDLLIQAWRKKIANEYSKVLTLLHLKFSKESIRALVIALSLSVELKALRMDYCHLKPFEAKLIAVFIKVHPSITVLHFNHNPLTDEGFLSIGHALLQNDTVKNLSFNEAELSDDSLEIMIKLLDFGQYQSFSLKGNSFSENAKLTLKERAYQGDCELILE